MTDRFTILQHFYFSSILFNSLMKAIKSFLSRHLLERHCNIYSRRTGSQTLLLNNDFFSRALSRSLTTTEPIKPHDKYRGINQEILRTLRLERQNTISYVDNTLKSVPGNVTRDKIEDEIHAAALKWSDKGFAEVGPTGNYEYFFIDSPVGGTRTYQRRDLKFGNEQIVCSCNFNYEELGPMSLSTDEKYAVRVVSQPLTNNTCQRILVRDIDASVDFQISILNRREDSYIPRIHNVEFGPTIDGTSERLYSLFITTCDELGRPNAVHGCIVSGEERSHSKSHLIFVDNDAAHFVDVQRTKGCEYVAIHSTSKSSNEIRLVGGDFRPILVRRRQDQVQYYIDCGVDKDVVIMALKNTSCALQKGTFESGDTGHFQIELGQEFSVFEATIGDMPLEESFGKKILFDQQQHEEETGKSIYFIEDMDLFDSKIVFYERSHVDGFQRMRVWDRREKREAIIPFPLCGDEERFILSSTGNMNYFSKCFQFIAESPILPPKCFRYDFKTGKIMKESETPNNDDKDDPTTRFHRILVDSSNEKKCPLTIVQKTEAASSGKPIILVGYGCYGQNQNLQFDPSIIPLVNRGFAIAFCHGRGGRELGHQWYQSGIRQNKIRSIEDYLACAKYLKSYNKGSETRTFLVAKAFSAGGVIVGSSLNTEPDLFQGVVLSNAFLDVMGAMSDSSLHLTEHEWDEFGNPRTSIEDFASISSYCPMNNIRPQQYPPCIIVGAVDDEIVPFYHSLVFGKQLRKKSIGIQNNICINLEESGGHQLSCEVRMKLEALTASFIIGQYHEWLRGL